jgi:nitrous oxide reductase accessory protein NosL
MNPRLQRLWLVLAAGVIVSLLLAVTWQRAGPVTKAPQTDDVCLVADPLRYDPASGLGLLEPRAVPSDARCPVCGMYPARSREWAAQLIFTNGDTHFFDSPLSLYLYLHDVGRFSRGRSAADVAVSYVTDVGTGAWVAADQAYYVHGSTALGPMRNGNLPAFASAAQAREFAQQRGGRVLRGDELSPALLGALDTRHSHARSSAPP